MKNLSNTAQFMLDFINNPNNFEDNHGDFFTSNVIFTFKDFKRLYTATFLLNKIHENNYLLYIFDREKLADRLSKNEEIGEVILKTYRNTDILESGLFDDLSIADYWKGFDELIEEIHCFYKPDVNKKQFDEWLSLMKEYNYMDQKQIDDVLSYVYFGKEEYNKQLN